jgi:hypothetical protein
MAKNKKNLFAPGQQPVSESHKEGLISINILSTNPRILIEIKGELPAEAHHDLLLSVDAVLKHYGK